MLLHQGIARALLSVMAKFNARRVERNRAIPLGHLHHILGRDEPRFSTGVDELLDEPGTNDLSTFTHSRVNHFMMRFPECFYPSNHLPSPVGPSGGEGATGLPIAVMEPRASPGSPTASRSRCWLAS
jgi:hypothetical protein